MAEKYTSPEETLTEIKHLMERSSRFISLSGLSGVMAGVYAIAGALAAYYFVYSGDNAGRGEHQENNITFLLADAALVLILAVATGIFLTTRKARKDGNSLLDAAAKKTHYQPLHPPVHRRRVLPRAHISQQLVLRCSLDARVLRTSPGSRQQIYPRRCKVPRCV